MSSAMNKGSTMTTYIASTAMVFDRARVSDRAQVFGQARVFDRARVHGQARVRDQAQVYGQARVRDQAQVYGQARVRDQARVHGQAWVYDKAQVYGRARVHGQARIAGQGDIASTRHYLTIGPVGSEDRTVTVHRHYDGPNSNTWGHLVIAGCWNGTLDGLEARIAMDGDHEWSGDASRWRADYAGLIAFARPRVAEWAAEPITDADHARWAGSEFTDGEVAVPDANLEDATTEEETA